MMNDKENKREALKALTVMFPDSLHVIQNHDKKDDIADATLQAAYWCDRPVDSRLEDAVT
jgi:hypothetical protein